MYFYRLAVNKSCSKSKVSKLFVAEILRCCDSMRIEDSTESL